MTEIVPLDLAALPAASAVIARAFLDDPGWIAQFPAHATREAKIRAVVSALSRELYVPLGASARTADGAAAAIWQPPGHVAPPLSALPRLAGSMLPVFGLGLLAAARLALKIEARRPATPHHYLYALAVAPSHQGRGLGAAVLAPGLARSDADGLPAWLESSNPRNHAFYEKMGFVAAGGLALPRGARATFFRREPRHGGVAR